jgi:hypothetical protein
MRSSGWIKRKNSQPYLSANDFTTVLLLKYILEKNLVHRFALTLLTVFAAVGSSGLALAQEGQLYVRQSLSIPIRDLGTFRPELRGLPNVDGFQTYSETVTFSQLLPSPSDPATFDVEYWVSGTITLAGANGGRSATIVLTRPANAASGFVSFLDAQASAKAWIAQRLLTSSDSLPGIAATVTQNSPSNPIVAQTVRTFTQQVFDNRATPLISKKLPKVTLSDDNTPPSTSTSSGDKASQQTAVRLARQQLVGADVSFENFSISSIDGQNLSLFGNYGYTTENGRFTFGANYVLNNLRINQLDLRQTSHNLGAFVSNILAADEGKDRSWQLAAGGTVNFISFPTSSAQGAGASLIYQLNTTSGQVFSLGTMYSRFTESVATYGFTNVAAQIGTSLGEQYAVNLEALYTHTTASIRSRDFVLLSPNFLTLGANSMIAFSSSFGINLGVRSTLFIENYRNLEFTIGSRLMF